MRLLVVVAWAYVFAASAVCAQENFARVGPYVGGGFAYGVENISLGSVQYAPGNQARLSADDSPGLDVRGGYRFHPNFAVEGDLQFFAFDLNADSGGYNGNFATLDTLSFMANAKAYALTGRVQPYGLFGLGLLYASLDSNNGYYYHGTGNYRYNGYYNSQDDAAFAVHFGGGVDVYVTPRLLINLECAYVLPANDLHFSDTGQAPGVDLSFIPIVTGVQYRF